MRAGYVWCTDRQNRAAMRAYLEGLDEHAGHVDPCGSTCTAAIGGPRND
jgi:hypothetical protein